jgi:hypothetical protein
MGAEYTAEQRLAKLVKLRELADHPATPAPQASAARDLLERRVICPDCGYKSRPVKSSPTDLDAMLQGMRDGQRLVPARLLEAAP